VDNQTIPFDPASNSADEPLYILSLLNNELMSYSWKLINKEYIIGRSSSSNIILDDVTVSREHAVLTVNYKISNIKDLNSTNGLYVNNEITQESKLKSGDKIQIGKYLLLITEVGK
tara:strand:+ start:1174 stop:1521 length:348 start_codon:yes stop_codon:yes gene_type:complete